jgi:hypothetical protein
MFTFYLLIFIRVRKILAQNSVIHTKRIVVNLHRNLSTHSDFKSDTTNILHMKTYAHLHLAVTMTQTVFSERCELEPKKNLTI